MSSENKNPFEKPTEKPSKKRKSEQLKGEKSDDSEKDDQISDLTGDLINDLSSESDDSTSSGFADYDLGGSLQANCSIKATDISKMESALVEQALGLKTGVLRSIKLSRIRPSADSMLEKFEEAPEMLLADVFKRLRDSLRTKRYPEPGASEAILSCHIGHVLDEINKFFLKQYEIEQDQLEIVPEWPVSWANYGGRIDYAVFRTDKKEIDVKEWKKIRKEYFYLVEMKAGDPLEALNQGFMYLSKLKRLDELKKKKLEEIDKNLEEIDKNLEEIDENLEEIDEKLKESNEKMKEDAKMKMKTYYTILSNAIKWCLVRLNDSGFLVSDTHSFIIDCDLANKPNEAADKKLFEQWKIHGSLMVHVIYTILKQKLSRVE